MNIKGKILGTGLLLLVGLGTVLWAFADTPITQAQSAAAAVEAAQKSAAGDLAPAKTLPAKPLEGTVVVQSSSDHEEDPYAEEASDETPAAAAPSFTLTKDPASGLATIDAPGEDIRNVVRKVADLYDLNIVIPTGLNGTTTLKLRNVSWKQLFDVMLAPAGFSYIEDKNIILIKSREEISAEPTETRVFLINYGAAGDLLASITPLIDATNGGRIQVDRRSNALVITERPSKFNNIKDIIERLDKATPQVLIESKFVDLDETDAKNLGLDWKSLNAYNLTAGSLRRNWSRSEGGTTPGKTFTDTAVFSASDFIVVLQALNTVSGTNLISNPTVVALNNTEATINIGQEYPIPQYSYNQQQGVFEVSGFEYKPIGVNLKVTPQVNNEGFITLKINPEVSSNGGTVTFGSTNGAEIPIILTRKTSSTITIKDGYTLAIGGLIENQKTPSVSKVPGLSKLPFAGRFFQSEKTSDRKRNLIIFITARTVSPDGSAAETVNPRQLADMKLTPDDFPGARPSADEQKALDELTERRQALQRAQAVRQAQQATQATPTPASLDAPKSRGFLGPRR